jgi:hypothetical protein
MNKALLKELLQLTPEERLDLVGELWDSLAQEELPPLTESQKCESIGAWLSTRKIRNALLPGRRSGLVCGHVTPLDELCSGC